MPRQRRVFVPGAPHHVYLHGNNRRRLFSSEEDRCFWLQCIERALDATNLAMNQHTLMTDNVHLILTPTTEAAVPAFVKRACQRYAQQRNVRLRASGKLFEEQYYSKAILDEQELMYTLFHNDSSAYRANRAADPAAHRWSTGPLHAGATTSKIPASLWTPLGWYRRLGRSPAERASAYRRLMAAYLNDMPWVPFDDGSSEPAFRGRVVRPDGTSAREPATQWGRESK